MIANPEIEKLTKRQKQCVKLFGDGGTYKAIAATLGISMSTVEMHLNEAKERLGITRGARLIKWAYANGLSPL